MDCMPEEKMVDFLNEETREEMSKDEIEAIKLHISQCAKCRKEMKKYIKLLENLQSPEFKKIVERELRRNGD